MGGVADRLAPFDPRPGVRIREGATLDGIHLSRTGARAVWDRVGPSIVEALSGQ